MSSHKRVTEMGMERYRKLSVLMYNKR